MSKSTVPKPQCITCKYKFLRRNGDLECRRFPPKVYLPGDGFRSPVVPDSFWCGEYKYGPSFGEYPQ